jgi:hypothetical protein
MPEYIEDIAKRHAERVGSPEVSLGEKTYSIYPEGLGGRIEEYWPTETAGRPDLRSMTIRREAVPAEEYDIEEQPQIDFNLGRQTIQRQFLDDMLKAESFKSLSPETYAVLAEEARMTAMSRRTKLQADLERTERQFKQIREDLNFSKAEQNDAKLSYYEKNPVWQTPRVGRPMDIMERLTAGAFAGVGEEPPPEEIPEQPLWQRFFGGRKEPEVRPIIGLEGKPITPPTREAEEVLPTPEQIAEYRRLGGSQTAAGRQYARDFIKQSEKEPTAPTPVGLPSKPIGYPDAVWNERLKAWTVIKDGQIGILKRKK